MTSVSKTQQKWRWLRWVLRWGLPGLVVFALSVVWHLPAKTLYDWVGPNLPAPLDIHPSGRWHHGQATLAWGATPLGQVQWRLDGSALLTGRLQSPITWQAGWGQVHTNMALSWGTPFVTLTQTRGTMDLETALAQWSQVSPALLMVNGMQGTVRLDALSVALAPIEQSPVPFWPSQVSGQVHIENWRMLEAQIPKLTLIPSLESQALVVRPMAETEAWSLEGAVRLLPQRRWHTEVTMQSQNQRPLPQWAGWLLPQTSNTRAELKQSGQW